MPTNAHLPLTTEELERLEELCQKATPGPWKWVVGGDGWDGKTCSLQSDAADICVLYGWGYDASGIGFGQDAATAEEEASLPDAQFIAAARTALPALLHEVRQSRQGWIPVSERLPERDKYVMFWAKELGEGFCETGYLRETEWEAERTDSYNDPITYSLDSEAVTHWRELPAAPDKEQV